MPSLSTTIQATPQDLVYNHRNEVPRFQISMQNRSVDVVQLCMGENSAEDGSDHSVLAMHCVGLRLGVEADVLVSCGGFYDPL